MSKLLRLTPHKTSPEACINPDTRYCPSCGADWQGHKIPVEVRSMYGIGVTHYSRLVGIEIEGGYDGVSLWRCPDCKKEWDRFV